MIEIPKIYKASTGIKEFSSLREAEAAGYRIYDFDKDLNMYLLRIFANDRWSFALCIGSDTTFDTDNLG